MGLPRVGDLPELPEPFEILELRNGQTVELRIVSWELGRGFIHPRDGRDPKWVQCLRVTVPPEAKATIPPYWDIMAKHLINGLLGYLSRGDGARYLFRITRHGDGPQGRFTLDAIPA